MISNALSRLRSRTAIVDDRVREVFANTAIPATVVAVGGYGRQELFPFSDVDLLLLVDSVNEATAALEGISRFQRQLWDLGLRVSQSVRTVAECCEIHEGNLELTISLLDRRLLAGDAARNAALDARFPKFIARERQQIIRHLCQMTRARHALFGGTIYHLEPNVKDHPGGLRDMHVLHWLGLLGAGDDDPNDVQALQDVREFLFPVRIRLHETSGRDNNLLAFDAQDSMSSDPAAWMREYYRHARIVFRAMNHVLHKAESSESGLLSQFRERRAKLSNTEFTVSRERILIREPALFESDASALMRLLQFTARHNLRWARDTERRVARLLALPGAISAASWQSWIELLKLPGCASAFRALHDGGLLSSWIPEWSHLDALVTRDFYHRYTVDEHTLVALEGLGKLGRLPSETKPNDTVRRFAELLREAPGAPLLRLAILLHDIGKGGGTGEHAEASVRDAIPVLDRLKVPPAERDTILFLIRHHLDLSTVMNSRDLEDPATAQMIAATTGTPERLALLTLLTYCDISAVNPQAMTPWRLDRLWRLYSVGHFGFTRELDSDRIHATEMDPEAAQFLEGLPVRYARTHSPAEIRSHIELARDSAASGAAVRIRKESGFFRAEIVSKDRRFLFAALSGALAGFGMNISHAEAFSNGRGTCIDTFVFSDPHRSLDLNPSEIDRLAGVLRQAALGSLNVEEMLRRRSKPIAPRSAGIESTVHFNNDASPNTTLIEITTRDRPALLHDLAQSISSAGLNIEVVLVNTEGHKAIDVFYVTGNNGKLDPSVETGLREKLLAAVA